MKMMIERPLRQHSETTVETSVDVPGFVNAWLACVFFDTGEQPIAGGDYNVTAKLDTPSRYLEQRFCMKRAPQFELVVRMPMADLASTNARMH